MGSPLEDAADAQRRTAEELQRLASELRRGGRNETRALFDPELVTRRSSSPNPPVTNVGLREIASETVRTVRGPVVASASGAARTGDGRRTLQSELREASGATRNLESTLRQNTDAVQRNTSGFANSVQGLLAGLGGAASSRGGFGSFLRSGFGLAPLGLAIAGLFGRGEEEEPPTFERFQLPAPIEIRAANSDDVPQRLANGLSERTAGGQAATPSRTAVAQVTVNVNAMDSQSFLDRSSDIARAVREAMLNMHPLNDMIEEL